MASRFARRSPAGLWLAVLIGALAGCAENLAENLADQHARTTVLAMAQRLDGHLVPASELVYATAVDEDGLTIDAMKASGSSREGELVLRIHVATRGGG